MEVGVKIRFVGFVVVGFCFALFFTDLVLEFQKTRWMRYKKRSIWGVH